MRITALLVLLLAGCNPAMAQTYPSKPVTLIVPYAPGGGTDIIARLTAQALFEEFGQTFIVDNRGGGGGMIGVEGAARATPDRYTLLFSSTGPVTISPVLFKNYCSSLPRVRRVRSKARVNLAFNGTKQDPSS